MWKSYQKAGDSSCPRFTVFGIFGLAQIIFRFYY